MNDSPEPKLVAADPSRCKYGSKRRRFAGRALALLREGGPVPLSVVRQLAPNSAEIRYATETGALTFEPPLPPPDPRFSRRGVARRGPASGDGETSPRTCLRCRETFDSHGPGNRLCRSCKIEIGGDRTAPGIHDGPV